MNQASQPEPVHWLEPLNQGSVLCARGIGQFLRITSMLDNVTCEDCKEILRVILILYNTGYELRA